MQQSFLHAPTWRCSAWNVFQWTASTRDCWSYRDKIYFHLGFFWVFFGFFSGFFWVLFWVFFLVFFWVFFWAFLTNFAPNLSIYHQNYVKNGYIFKTVNQIIFFSTQCIILLLFLVFSQIKIGAALWAPPIKTKVWKRPIKSKVKYRSRKKR